MTYKSDIEIAQSAEMLPITQIAQQLELPEDVLELYGRYKAKIDFEHLPETGKQGKVILVTAITPTPAGEGKTTTVVGLGDALHRLGKRTVIALREPSLGPVFGVKGGAAGGGYAQVVPMEDINLHFTGDFHAIGAANNLMCAVVDNHIYHGNELNLDVRRIVCRRAMDMNDRQLRNIVNGIGGKANGVPREGGFDITVASEVMAALCLATDLMDLKHRLGKIVVGYTFQDKPVTVSQLKIEGAMAALLKDAIKPNLVQTLEHTPALIHGGPFANIAHGCNSAIATKTAMKLADYVVTEAGFGADLGAEKFIDIKCRQTGIRPDAVVIVATVRALKMHGGVPKNQLGEENLDALRIGMGNLCRHIHNITRHFGLPVVVAVNRFPADTEAELQLVQQECCDRNVRVILSEVWAKGGEGALELAKEVIRLAEGRHSFRFLYEDSLPLRDKIDTIVREIYHGEGADFVPAAVKDIKRIEEMGYGHLPICMAKTQYSFSDNQKLLGAPEGFRITVRSLKVSAGAGFVVVYTGEIMTMPGLPKVPSAEKIDIDQQGNITGLF